MSAFKEMTAEVVKKSEAAPGPATPPAGAAPGTARTADAAPPAPKKSIWERLFGHKA